MTTATHPAPTAIEVRELVFKVEGTGTWTVEEGDERMGIQFVWGEGRCPWCGHNPGGPLEVPLHPLTGDAMHEVIYCGANIQYPWWHPCGRPILLVPEFDQLEDE